jgi:hypothetical protein
LKYLFNLSWTLSLVGVWSLFVTLPLESPGGVDQNDLIQSILEK